VLGCARQGIRSVLVAALVVALQLPLSEVVWLLGVEGLLPGCALADPGSPWAAAEGPDLILVYCCVSLGEVVGGSSAGLKCLCDMGLLGALKLPLPLPTLAASTLAWAPALVLLTRHFSLQKQKTFPCSSGLGLEKLHPVHSRQSA
jgi:hypothetical protein